VSLKRALELLPDDRLTRAAIEAVLRYLDSHRLLHVDAHQVAIATRQEEERVHQVLAVLASARVLDFVSDPPGFRLISDRVLDLEMGRFLRASQNSSSSLQSSVDRFRRTYGGH
jgi:hypothetical protein